MDDLLDVSFLSSLRASGTRASACLVFCAVRRWAMAGGEVRRSAGEWRDHGPQSRRAERGARSSEAADDQLTGLAARHARSW